MRNIRTVTILGANGNVGSQCAGIIAGFGGVVVHMLARNIDKAEFGIERAIQSIRSDSIREQLIPGTYDHDLKEAIQDSDWVLEVVAEDYTTKSSLLSLVDPHLKPGTIVSSGTSGLSIEKLSKALKPEARHYFFGTHFFNPPYKMLLCEFISTSQADPEVTEMLSSFLSKTLRRQVVHVADSPAFAGNRIGFLMLNLAVQLAQQHKDRGGIPFIDTILGGFTGRVFPLLKTIDLVGLDIHKAIVDHIYAGADGQEERDMFLLPDFMQQLINLGRIGRKARQGLYDYVSGPGSTGAGQCYDILTGQYRPVPEIQIEFADRANALIRVSDYSGAVNVIRREQSLEGEICRYVLARYIGYAFSLVGTVVPDRESLDTVMGFGFNWVPPSAWVDLLGGVKETVRFLEQAGVTPPEVLLETGVDGPCYTLKKTLDPRSLFRANC